MHVLHLFLTFSLIADHQKILLSANNFVEPVLPKCRASIIRFLGSSRITILPLANNQQKRSEDSLKTREKFSRAHSFVCCVDISSVVVVSDHSKFCESESFKSLLQLSSAFIFSSPAASLICGFYIT